MREFCDEYHHVLGVWVTVCSCSMVPKEAGLTLPVSLFPGAIPRNFATISVPNFRLEHRCMTLLWGACSSLSGLGTGLQRRLQKEVTTPGPVPDAHQCHLLLGRSSQRPFPGFFSSSAHLALFMARKTDTHTTLFSLFGSGWLILMLRRARQKRRHLLELAWAIVVRCMHVSTLDDPSSASFRPVGHLMSGRSIQDVDRALLHSIRSGTIRLSP